MQVHKAELGCALQAAVQAVHNCTRVGFRQSQLVRKAQQREHRRRLQEEQRCRLQQQLDAIRAEVRPELLTGGHHTAEGFMCCLVRAEGLPCLTGRQASQTDLLCVLIRTGCWMVTVLLSWLHSSSLTILQQVCGSPPPASAGCLTPRVYS